MLNLLAAAYMQMDQADDAFRVPVIEQEARPLIDSAMISAGRRRAERMSLTGTTISLYRLLTLTRARGHH